MLLLCWCLAGHRPHRLAPILRPLAGVSAGMRVNRRGPRPQGTSCCFANPPWTGRDESSAGRGPRRHGTLRARCRFSCLSPRRPAGTDDVSVPRAHAARRLRAGLDNAAAHLSHSQLHGIRHMRTNGCRLTLAGGPVRQPTARHLSHAAAADWRGIRIRRFSLPVHSRLRHGRASSPANLRADPRRCGGRWDSRRPLWVEAAAHTHCPGPRLSASSRWRAATSRRSGFGARGGDAVLWLPDLSAFKECSASMLLVAGRLSLVRDEPGHLDARYPALPG